MNWIARIDWIPERQVDINEVCDRLSRHGPVLDVTRDGAWSITIALNLPTLRIALSDAISKFEAATGERPTGIEVIPLALAERRLEWASEKLRGLAPGA